MAIKLETDKSLIKALRYLEKKKKKNASELIKELILETYNREKGNGLMFGAFAFAKTSSQEIKKFLKEVDDDKDDTR